MFVNKRSEEREKKNALRVKPKGIRGQRAGEAGRGHKERREATASDVSRRSPGDAALEAEGRKWFKLGSLNSKNRQEYEKFEEKLKTKGITIGKILFGADMGKRGRK